ncbi:phage tail protein [Vibrio fluvialis]|nr:phage tail protein [Vibrio fluvialis]MBY8248136.1 phage tail protein [Vibrio fluvialis]MBY8281507.1 phage tail protein [Vibrio fluvialis]
MSYRVGYKMHKLRAFIEARLGKQIAQKLDAEMSDIELILSPRNMGMGMDIAYQRYTAEFLIDRLPFKKYNPAVLFANVAAWLMDNDEEREEQLGELKDPVIEVVIEDEQNAEVLIQIVFEEPIKIVEDESGDIYWRNKRWKIQEYEIWVAESLRDVVIPNAED